MNGFLNLFKPKGVSSAYVLNAVKKAVKGNTVGHMGTLDPLASGVLPVAIGKSTRLFDYLLDKKKEYVATVAFGYATDSGDLEGKIIEISEIIPSREEIETACRKLTGEIMQVPPAYSAKCVNGKRSYELARRGQIVELPPKKVIVYSIDVGNEVSSGEYEIKIVCGGGTYIRALARDIGKLCGSVATMTSLVRVASGVFRIEDSITAEEFAATTYKASLLTLPDEVIDFPVIRLTDKETERLFNGLYDVFDYPDGVYRIYSPKEFYGVGEVIQGKIKVKAYLRDSENI